MLISAFWSDPHFGHANIIEYAQRPYHSVSEMDAALITNYNEIVDDNDVVVWLGDAFLCSREKSLEIMSRLKGRKILIRGNHDRGASAMLSLGFDIVADKMSVQIAGRTCTLCHYPYAGADRHGKLVERAEYLPERKKGEYLIHGHTHSRKMVDGHMLHVGIDAWNWRPVTYDRVAELVKNL
jgi:calcineurin-like phosphoesterase family protein